MIVTSLHVCIHWLCLCSKKHSGNTNQLVCCQIELILSLIHLNEKTSVWKSWHRHHQRSSISANICRWVILRYKSRRGRRYNCNKRRKKVSLFIGISAVYRREKIYQTYVPPYLAEYILNRWKLIESMRKGVWRVFKNLYQIHWYIYCVWNLAVYQWV